jgi:hypothetical protein
MPVDPSQDQDFLKAPRDRQIQYLQAVDPDFAKAPPERQNAYLDSVASATRSTVDAPRSKFGPHPSATSPLSHFLPELNERMGQVGELIGRPMQTLRGVEQSVKDYQAQRDPSQGNRVTRGLGVLGKGIADTASDYWEHPGHLAGDVATGAIIGMAGSKPTLPPVETGATEGIPWGSGGKGPLALRGKMIPAEPPAQFSGTATATIPVRPSAAAPVYEPSLPGVNARPSVERLPQSTSALERASEPPAPANPSAVQVKPSIGRIQEFSAKPVEASASTIKRVAGPTAGTTAGAVSDTQLFQQARAELGDKASVSDIARRAQELKTAPIAKPPAAAPAGVKPVTTEPSEPIVRKARELTHRLGKAVEGFDPSNPEHERLLNARREDLAEAANKARVDGRTDWKPGEFSRAGLGGKDVSPVKAHVLSELFKGPGGEPDIETEMRTGHPNPPGPPKPKSLASRLPTPEEDARIRKMMTGRDVAKRDLEKGAGR